MFNGIIEHLGTVTAVSPLGKGARLVLDAGPLAGGMQPGDSLAVNGVCLTATRLEGSLVTLESVAETLSKTNLAELRPGGRVNLERPLAADGRVHGHWVAGHVDSTARIAGIRHGPESSLFSFELPPELAPCVVPRGSVAIDGVSLTVARLEAASFTVAVIAFTLAHTNLGLRRPGERVNLETDMLGKYVVHTLERLGLSGRGLNEDKLRAWGF